MTKDEIIEMANEAELCQSIWIDSPDENLASVIRFAKLVAAKEREACAKLCETFTGSYERGKEMEACAAAIRARGEA